MYVPYISGVAVTAVVAMSVAVRAAPSADWTATAPEVVTLANVLGRVSLIAKRSKKLPIGRPLRMRGVSSPGRKSVGRAPGISDWSRSPARSIWHARCRSGAPGGGPAARAASLSPAWASQPSRMNAPAPVFGP